MEKKVALVGIGNPNFEDDQIGHAFIDYMSQQLELDLGNTMDIMINNSNIEILLLKEYQLDICLISTIKCYDIIIFIDASKNSLQSEKESIKLVEPIYMLPTYSNHINSIEYMTYFLKTYYSNDIKVYLLSIIGESWELKPELKKTYDFSTSYRIILEVLNI